LTAKRIERRNREKCLFAVKPHATIHPRCFYLRDDGDPTMQVGREEFKNFVTDF
jgi:hypothetical protein